MPLRAENLQQVRNASTSRESWHLGQLDALRGIAILMVMAVHAVYWGPDHVLPLHPSILGMIAFSGQRGVQLFFIVSAFTLYMSHANRRHEARPNLNFFIRRFFRISPMLYVAVVLAWMLWPEVLGTRKHVVLSLVYLSGFSPSTINSGAAGSWSVATEAAFYMLLPLLFRWIFTPVRAVWALVFAATFSLFILPRLASHFGDGGYWLLQSLPANLATFLFGIFGFFVWQELIAPATPKSRRFISTCFLVGFGVGYAYALPFFLTRVTFESAVLLLLTLGLISHPWRLLVNSATVRLGKLSYSLYLLHFYVARYVERFLLHEAEHHTWARAALFQFCAEYLVTLAITYVLALGTWRYIERPGMRIGQFLIAKLEGRAAKRLPEVTPPLSSLLDTPDAQF